MPNWLAQNRTVFDIETVFMLNWIVWIRTIWLNWIAWNRNIFNNETVLMLNWIVCIKMDLALNNLQMLICHKTQPTHTYM